MQGENFLILGNDEKMVSCMNRFSEMGYDCECYNNESIKRKISYFKYIVLPLPSIANGCIAGTGIGLNEFYDIVDSEHTVLYGNIINPKFRCNAFSYYYNESFLINNSRLTAQGVLKIILSNIDEDLHDITAAVIGYGRCGKAICRTLKNNGMSIKSYSRRGGSRAEAENDGMLIGSCKELEKQLNSFDVIINTVPENIINEKTLEKFTNKNLYIEIASRPYGFDIARIDKFNFRYILAESLPGKFTPVSAGKNIADTVISMLKEGKE